MGSSPIVSTTKPQVGALTASRVRGAAGVLQTEAGIRSDTIAKLLLEHGRPGGPGDRWRLRRGEVVLVDEAGMVASRDLARVAHLVEQAEAKLVLVGDYAQLGAVEAGGLFRLLADTSRHLGNFPQAFTHLALISAAVHAIAGVGLSVTAGLPRVPVHVPRRGG